MENSQIAVCCITYNRIDSLKRLLKSLEDAYYSNNVTLIISIDKSETDIIEVFADNYNWKYGNKIVIKHNENLGLRRHILSCGDLLKEYEALIVLEDDITVAPSYYQYATLCVQKYKGDNNCAGISLYNFPLNYHNGLPFTPIHSDSDVYMMKCAQSWGQVWMKRQWFEFRKWYASHDEEFGYLPHLPKSICSWPKSSWLKYHTRYCIEEDKFFIYPYVSLSTNNGDAGTHAIKRDSDYQSSMIYGKKEYFNLNPTVKYDGFFENKSIARALGLPSEELCVDLYGGKCNRENCRYWLTTLHKDYKILKSYALELKPWDGNILQERSGNDIFLYDTTIKRNNKFKNHENVVDDYFYPMKNEIIRRTLKNGVFGKLLSFFHALSG